MLIPLSAYLNYLSPVCSVLAAILDALSPDTYPRTAAAIVSQDQRTFAREIGHNRQSYTIPLFRGYRFEGGTDYYQKWVNQCPS